MAMRKIGYAALICVLLAGVAIGGCGKKTGGGAADQVFNKNLATEPPSLDPALAQDNVSFMVLAGMYEGLTNKDPDGKVVPGIAEKWDISDDQKTYTFHLRQDAKWSNGDPVTAGDFEYAWKRVLSPDLNPPSPYAYQLYYVKNGQNYNVKENNPNHVSDPAQVGVSAKDDYTLEVQLENPTPYFLSITSFGTTYPIHKSAKDNAAWAAEASSMISNGAFKIASWKHGNELDLVPNENYYAKSEIRLKKVHFVMVDNASTELQMYESGQLHYAGLPGGEIPNGQIASLKTSHKDELQIKPIASSYYYLFNTTKAPFDNKNVRKALSMAIDRKQLVEKVTQGGELPSYAFVPPSILGEKESFRSEYSGDLFKEDVAGAKTLLEQGLKEKGLTKLPAFTLSYNTSDKNKAVAEAVADYWRKNLGLDVKIANQEFKVFLKDRTGLKYDVARAGWGADYNDPMTYIDLFVSGGGNNDIGFKNKAFDALVKEAYSTADQKKRMEAMYKAEKILIEDEMAIIPLYYYSNVNMIKTNLKNVIVDYQGQMDYTRAYFE